MAEEAAASSDDRMPGDDAREAVAVNLRRHRLARGLSLRELGDASGSSKGLLSQLERGTANPTIDLLGRIGSALDLSINDLIRDPLITPEVIRAAGGGVETVAVRTLFSSFERRRIEMSESDIAPNRRSDRSSHGRGSIEYAYVVDGAVKLESEGWSVDLGVGDAIRFSAEFTHCYATSAERARVLTIVGFAVD